MKGCLIFILSIAVLILCGVVAFLALRQPEVREKLVFVDSNDNSDAPPLPETGPSDRKDQGQLSLLVEKVNQLLKKSDETPSTQLKAEQPTPPTTTSQPEKKVFDQRWDADRAFAKDQLFAVTSKRTIRREYYTDHLDRNPFGNPRTKYHPAIYIVKAMGRETRESYLFIVPREFHDRAMIYQKFTKTQLSNFEYFLSEAKLEREIFYRRFRGKIID